MVNNSHRIVASSNTHYCLGNQLFVKKSHYTRIKNPLHEQSEKACVCLLVNEMCFEFALL